VRDRRLRWFAAEFPAFLRTVNNGHIYYLGGTQISLPKVA
jgi:hypothetical protein